MRITRRKTLGIDHGGTQILWLGDKPLQRTFNYAVENQRTKIPYYSFVNNLF